MIFLSYHRRPCFSSIYRLFFTGSHHRLYGISGLYLYEAVQFSNLPEYSGSRSPYQEEGFLLWLSHCRRNRAYPERGPRGLQRLVQTDQTEIPPTLFPDSLILPMPICELASVLCVGCLFVVPFNNFFTELSFCYCPIPPRDPLSFAFFLLVLYSAETQATGIQPGESGSRKRMIKVSSRGEKRRRNERT